VLPFLLRTQLLDAKTHVPGRRVSRAARRRIIAFKRRGGELGRERDEERGGAGALFLGEELSEELDEEPSVRSSADFESDHFHH
jgi:hypothetical protein